MELYKYIGIVTFILFLVLLYTYIKKARKKNVLFSCVICFFVTGAMVSMDPDTGKSIGNDKTSEKVSAEKPVDNIKQEQESDEHEPNDDEHDEKYLTNIQWADTSNYMFAVEIDNFEGDVFKSGRYNFISTGETDGKHVAIVWDIYVSKNKYQNMSELSESEFVTSVGGTENNSCSLNLEKGKYVYVNYNKPINKPSGMLEIKLVE